MNKLFKALRDHDARDLNTQALFTEVVRSKDNATIIGAAVEGESTFKADREARNLYLSALRVRLGRACEALKVDAITVKKVDGAWAVVVKEKAAKAADPLARALKMVCENITAKRVQDALREAMSNAKPRLAGGRNTKPAAVETTEPAPVAAVG